MTLTNNTFIGEYAYSLDSKGRVNIPAKFRQS
ncbi:MAG: cell division/cell wall cluster transcriptional repressor MraZ, partial [Candidatus Marinimicrobia bacterium]|nr:cell division/cell wall cluster transcriptional repressor MraZ [Candidatus Neomarinimicrobiota bacterium]